MRSASISHPHKLSKTSLRALIIFALASAALAAYVLWHAVEITLLTDHLLN